MESKRIDKLLALKFIWERFGRPYIFATGSDIDDMCVLCTAPKVVIPSHSEIAKSWMLPNAEIVDGGMDSGIEAIKIARKTLNTLLRKEE